MHKLPFAVVVCLGFACTARNAAYEPGPTGGTCGGAFDVHNCGACGHDCTAAPGVSVAACVNGACVITSCRSGLAHCTTDPEGGCDTDITTPAHCGGCTTACPALCARSAFGYQCVTACGDPTPTQCGSRCVDLFTDVHHCGACATDCAATDPAASCVGGACVSTARPPDLASAPVVDMATAPPPDLSQPATGGATVYVNDLQTLYVFDPNTLTLSTVGQFAVLGLIEQIVDVALAASGQLYGLAPTDFWSVNTTTGRASTQSQALFTQENGWTGVPGGLMLSGAQNGDVHLTDPNAGSTQKVGNAGVRINDMVAFANGTVYALFVPLGTTTPTVVSLGIVNTATGAISKIGATNFTGLYGMAFGGGKLLAFSGTGQVVQLDPSTGAGTLLKTYSGMSFDGAASSPLLNR
jgi:hypothetical protein